MNKILVKFRISFSKNWNPFLFLIPALIIVIIFIILPWFFSLLESITISNPLNVTQTSIGIDHFNAVANSELFLSSFKSSNILFFIVVPIAMIISTAIAFLINSFTKRIVRNFIVTTFFSQFFISIYAIGISFIFLFNVDKNVLNNILGTDVKWLNDSVGNTSIYALSIFLIWRLVSFNVVFIYFALQKIEPMQFKIASLDNISFIKKIQIIYIPNLSKVMKTLVYLNLLEAIFLFPLTLFSGISPLEDVNINNASTIANYIYFMIRIQEFGQAGAATLISISYIVGLFLLYFFTTYSIHKLHKFYKFKKYERVFNA
ncbi:hypothetical protein CG473_00950 [Mycoplasma testudineum]|nr:hypothetical protein CG473_00950 [Mycoplasma testudineum]